MGPVNAPENSELVDLRSCPDCGGARLSRRALKDVEKKAAAVNGTPEPIIATAVSDVALVTGAWAGAIASNCTGDNAIALNRDITSAIKTEDLALVADPTEEAIMHALALGCLDSAYEVETDNAIAAPALPAPESVKASRRMLAGGVVTNRILGFSSLPYAEATDQFLQLKVITRRSWDALSEKAKLRSFTIANATKKSMIEVAQRELARQVARGADLRDFRKRVAKRLESNGWTPANPSHVETIFRTNVQRSYTAGRVEHAMKPSVLRARPLWQVVTVNDGPPRQRATHRSNHGRVLRADNPIWKTKMMPWGFNCYRADAVVSGDFIGASKAWYSGQMVQITSAEGRRLTVTANHPVLTARGLVAAQHLRESDDLICDRLQPGIALLGQRAQWDKHDGPATAEQVFQALREQERFLLSVRARADDFHGEAQFFDGQVEVVGSYRKLAHDAQRSRAQQVEQLGFESPDLAASSGSSLGEFFSGTSDAGRGVTRGSDLPTSRGLAHARPFDGFGLALISHWNASLSEARFEGATGDAALFRELIERGAGAVVADKLLEIRKFDFSGHVFDLETRQGWMTADGIAASNCRCRFKTLPKDYAGTISSDLLGVPDEGFTAGVEGLI